MGSLVVSAHLDDAVLSCYGEKLESVRCYETQLEQLVAFHGEVLWAPA